MNDLRLSRQEMAKMEQLEAQGGLNIFGSHLRGDTPIDEVVALLEPVLRGLIKREFIDVVEECESLRCRISSTGLDALRANSMWSRSGVH